jgi:thioredoxin 1
MAALELSDPGGRLAILLLAAAGGVLLLLAYRLYRSRAAGTPDEVALGEVGLEAQSRPGFLLFTQPSCHPCKAARQVVDAVVEESRHGAAVTAVDTFDRSDLAVRYGVRALPTLLLVAPGGRVVQRWTRVPRREELRASLESL